MLASAPSRLFLVAVARCKETGCWPQGARLAVAGGFSRAVELGVTDSGSVGGLARALPSPSPALRSLPLSYIHPQSPHQPHPFLRFWGFAFDFSPSIRSPARASCHIVSFWHLFSASGEYPITHFHLHTCRGRCWWSVLASGATELGAWIFDGLLLLQPVDSLLLRPDIVSIDTSWIWPCPFRQA